jgi:site-specific recombinase XerD
MRALPYFCTDPAEPPPQIAAYLAARAREGLGEASLYAYRRDLMDVATFIEEATGAPFSAAAVTTAQILDYKATLRIRRLSGATINRRQASLRGFLRYAQAMRWIADDPMRHIRAVRLTPPPPRSLAPGEEDDLLAAVRRRGRPRDEAMICTLLYAGLRVGELCSLRLDDLDLTCGHESLLVRSGKGDRDRQLPLARALRQALGAYLAVRPPSTDTCVFLGQRGQGLAPATVQEIVRAYGVRAGIADLTPHRLRHQFARQLLRAGADIMSVAQLLGHQNIATTMIYTRASEDDLRAAVERLAGR